MVNQPKIEKVRDIRLRYCIRIEGAIRKAEYMKERKKMGLRERKKVL